MKQKVLKNTEEVFASLMQEFDNAKHEILAAITFFTNKTILEKLTQKASEGLRVYIIVSDNYRNEDLDFSTLTNYETAEVIKKSNTMNLKYCIIDRQVVIQGSYNWTLNSNTETTAINSRDKTTVKDYIDIFFQSIDQPWEMKKNNKKYQLIPWFKKSVKPSNVDAEGELETNAILIRENDPLKNEINEQYDVDEVLNSIITSEIQGFDRDELSNQGYQSAQKVQGDAHVLLKKMDSLYFLFIRDKGNIRERKKSLQDKIIDTIEKFKQSISNKYNEKIRVENEKMIVQKKEYDLRKADLDGLIESKNAKAKAIEETDINELNKEILAIEEEIKKLDPDLLKPIKKRYTFIPLVIFAITLGIGLFLFYASCVYILFYAEHDILMAMKSGNGTLDIGIFVSESLRLSWEAGGIFAMIYAALFCMIPFVIGYISHESKKWKKIGSWVLIFIIDALIAVNVSNTIQKVSAQSGLGNGQSMFLSEKIPEYIIILFLGLIPMIFFVIVIKRIIQYYDDNHPERGRLVKEQEKGQLTQNALDLDGQVYALVEQKNELMQQIIELQNEKKTIAIKELYLPQELNEKVLALNEKKDGEMRFMEKKRNIYINAIDNDSIRISINALKDRVSVFLEGWNEWLHVEYSKEVAIQRSKEASQMTDIWMSENVLNMNSNFIDQNILKLNA